MSNIFIGALAGSCPALAGPPAATNAISLPAILIALLVFLWTPGHFWALAYRSREDYRRARLPMLPAVSDERTSRSEERRVGEGWQYPCGRSLRSKQVRRELLN